MFSTNAEEKNGDSLSVANGGGITVRIRKPADFSSKKIRDIILREYFGYTEKNISDFTKQYPNKYLIQHSENPGIWASVARVKSWKVEADGLTEIDLTANWAAEAE